MDYSLKVVLPYEGVKKYINTVRTAESPDLGKLWLEHAIDPYWSEWAAGQFNEERTHAEMSGPVADIDKLETAVEMLSAFNIEELLRNTYDKIVQLLPPQEPEKAVCIYPNLTLGESLHGVVGACLDDNFLIQVNPAVSGWERYIPWVLACVR